VKIVVNMGVSASLEKGAVEDAAKDLSLITGRKPAISKSRHSIANFKLRETMPIGCRVTLRAMRCMNFSTGWLRPRCRASATFAACRPASLTAAAITRSASADQTIFPEIELDKIKRQQGMDITIVTSAPTDEEALDLLKLMGFPFAEK
jgi:large subunit ribosomal protein L5